MTARDEGDRGHIDEAGKERVDSQDVAKIAAPSDDALIWRYMDLMKYVALLESSSLYLARADQFRDDQYEGFPTAMPGFIRLLELKRRLKRHPTSEQQAFEIAWPQRYTYVSC